MGTSTGYLCVKRHWENKASLIEEYSLCCVKRGDGSDDAHWRTPNGVVGSGCLYVEDGRLQH